MGLYGLLGSGKALSMIFPDFILDVKEFSGGSTVSEL
jgi:hypothetical protein